MKKCSEIKRNILEIIAVSGEVYRQDLMCVFGYTKGYIRQVLGELQADNLIKENMFNNRRTVRLTHAGKKYLIQLYPERCEKYLTGIAETNKLRSEQRRRERTLRMAQVLILLRQAKVKIFSDEKVLLYKNFSPLADKSDGQGSEFYTSTELKELIIDFNKARGSRALGILITDFDVYIVYHTGKEPLKWQELTELKFRITAENEIVRKVFGNQKELKWLVIGNDSDLPEKLTKKNNDGKMKYMSILSDKLAKNYVQFRREDLPAIRIIVDRALREKAEYCTKMQCGVANRGNGRFSETDEIGNPVLLALDFDMRRIHDFATHLYISRKQGSIICFDFQKRYLQMYAGEQIKIQSIGVREYEEQVKNAKTD